MEQSRLPSYMYWLTNYLLMPMSIVGQGYIFGVFASTGFVAHPEAPGTWGLLYGAGFVLLFVFGACLAGISLLCAEQMVMSIRDKHFGWAIANAVMMSIFVVVEMAASLNDRVVQIASTPLNDMLIYLFGLPEHPIVAPVEVAVSVLLPIVNVVYAIYRSSISSVPKKEKAQERAGGDKSGNREEKRNVEITGSELSLGQTGKGAISLPLEKVISISIIGKPGRGKSSLLRFLTAQALRHKWDVTMFDPHLGMRELQDEIPLYSDAQGIRKGAQELLEELERRKEELNAKGEVTSPPHILIVDELPVVSGLVPEAVEVIKAFVLEGRKFRLYPIVAGQGVPAALFGESGKGSLVRDMFSTRYVFDVSEEQARMAKLSRQGRDLLKNITGRVGVAILENDSRNTAEVVSIPPDVVLREKDEEEREEIISLHKEGMSRTQIQRHLGKGGNFYSTIKKVLDDYESQRDNKTNVAAS